MSKQLTNNAVCWTTMTVTALLVTIVETIGILLNFNNASKREKQVAKKFKNDLIEMIMLLRSGENSWRENCHLYITIFEVRATCEYCMHKS